MSFQSRSQTEAITLNYLSSSIGHLSPKISRRYTTMSTGNSNNSRPAQAKTSSGMYRSSIPTFISTCNKSYLAGALFGYSKSCNTNRFLASNSPDSTYHYNINPVNLTLSRNYSNNSNNTSSTFDLSKYSPHNYVPNIQRNCLLTNAASRNSSTKRTNSNFTSTTADLLGGDEISCERRNCQVRKSGFKSLPLLASGKPLSNAAIKNSINLTFEEGSSSSRSTGRCRLVGTYGDHCGLNGLRNIGNTCFMNSVIQCLSNTRPLLEYLLNEQYLNDINTTTSSMKGALIKAFSQVVEHIWEKEDEHVVNTSTLKSQIQRFAPRFMGYSQQDAQEFLRYLLEGLHEDVNRVINKPQPIFNDIPENYSDTMKAAESWKRYLRNEDSMIVDVFVGQLRSSLRCTDCDHVSVTLDPFWDLSLPIPTRHGSVKLSQCLEHFTREEVLDGDEKPTCFKCQMRRKCTKSFSIQKFPKILVIHLKRFSPMERFRGKLNVLVDFPLAGLELSAFAAERVQGCTYNLYGVANHSGTTHSGHYTAYCKHPYSGEWHEYNDSRVNPVSARSIISSEAYVLFYEQQTHNSHL